MRFRQFLIESNAIARTNALKKQQELIDAGKKNIEITKLPHGVYQLTSSRAKKSWFCAPDGRIRELMFSTTCLLTDSYYAYHYALVILRGPFPEGEQAIATDAYHAYYYAKNILNGPFPAGEAAIATDQEYSYHYALDVLNGPFPAGEKVLATDAWYAYLYARDVLKGPWAAGEKAIMKSKHKAEYEEFLASLKL